MRLALQRPVSELLERLPHHSEIRSIIADLDRAVSGHGRITLGASLEQFPRELLRIAELVADGDDSFANAGYRLPYVLPTTGTHTTITILPAQTEDEVTSSPEPDSKN